MKQEGVRGAKKGVFFLGIETVSLMDEKGSRLGFWFRYAGLSKLCFVVAVVTGYHIYVSSIIYNGQG